MREDLETSSSEYAWLLTIFYISYIIFEFLVLFWKIVPPHLWAASTVFLWGKWEHFNTRLVLVDWKILEPLA